MDFKKIHHNLMYDEFGKKDYEGYLLPILMSGYVIFLFFILPLLGLWAFT